MSKWIRIWDRCPSHIDFTVSPRLVNTAHLREVLAPQELKHRYRPSIFRVEYYYGTRCDDDLECLSENFPTEAEAQARFDEIAALLIGDSPGPPPRRKVVRG